MALHRLASITIGVPNVEEVSGYYAEFGLSREGACFSTTDGGEQLRIVSSPTRRLIELCIAADDPDDLDRVTSQLGKLGINSQRDPDGAAVRAIEVHSGARAVVTVLPRISQEPAAGPYNGPYNAPGQAGRENDRASGILRQAPIRAPQAGPCRDWHPGCRSDAALLHRWHRVPGKRRGPGRRGLHAVLHRSSQPADPAVPGRVPASHVLAGR